MLCKKGQKMKKLSMFIILLVVALLSSCVSVPKRTLTSTDLLNELDTFDFVVNKHLEFGDGLYQAMHPNTTFTNGFNITIINNSNKVAKVIWNNSSITDEVSTYSLFLDGLKYINAGAAIPPTVLSPNGKLNRSLFSAEHVRYNYRVWVIDPMAGNDFTITICIEVDGKEYYLSKRVLVTEPISD